jgi:hypothetical protein
MPTEITTLPQLYLHRDRVFIISKNDAGYTSAPVLPYHLATTLGNLLKLGYTLSPHLMVTMGGLPRDQFVALVLELIEKLKVIRGAHRRYQPMYPNFPEQVLEASEAELIINQVLHYWFGLVPEYIEEARAPLELPPLEQVTVLELGTSAQFLDIPRLLLASKSSISASEKEELEWFFQIFKNDSVRFLPEQIPFKENVATVAGLVLKYTTLEPETLTPYIKNATDVLRIAAALSGGDVSLAKPTKFRSFKRKERRLLLALLEAQPNRLEDASRYPEQWKRLAHGLHVGEMKGRYPGAYQALALIRSGAPDETYNSLIETALARGDTATALFRAVQRPGDFARRLDHLLRLAPSYEKRQNILGEFDEVAEKVSTPVLLQLLSHFRHRPTAPEFRAFFPKGDLAKLKVLPNTVLEIPEWVCDTVVQICRRTLITRFGELPPLGAVYVDPALAGYAVPLSARSASKSLRTLTRGSRIPFPGKARTIRFFLWWKEGKWADGTATGRVDIDLSTILFDADWKQVTRLYYGNQRVPEYGLYHSGDITSAPKGACEFIDLDLDRAIKAGARYALMSVNGYTEQNFAALPECYAGWMLRDEPQSGAIFEPSTVQDKVDLAAEANIAIPVILDLADRKLIWTDLALKRNLEAVNNIDTNRRSLNLLARAMAEVRRPDLYELFSLHAAARGERVTDPARAETIFGTSTGTVTAFDQEQIRANYL